MTSSRELQKPVYEVEGKLVSILDLLKRFLDPARYRDGIARLSDLHLTVGQPATYRLDGELVRLVGAAPLSASALEGLLFPLLTGDQVQKLAGPALADVDAGFEWKEEGVSFRINAFHERNGLAAAIRVLPKKVPDVSAVGFPSERVWKEILELRQGLVIVTGITGSGKSTTIASLIHHLNKSAHVRIITLEDPIEYVLESGSALISQREVGKHLSAFHTGLRSALREDPDVIFVGEMRDAETTSLALTAAETGHLVLSTMHTKDSRGVLSRIVDLFPAERSKEVCAQLSFSLSCILAQKLVPRADGNGQRVAMEVLKNLPAVANLIRTGQWHQIYSQMETQRRQGLITLERHLEDLLERGEITKETAARYSNVSSLADR